MLAAEPLKSPCILVCQLDENNVCQGCYRTMHEISHWIIMTEEQKNDVLIKIKQRFKDANPHLEYPANET
ncbi:MAG: DUF1289 domain-containing protein [bacterium]|nr:DUF1289 domain-containing protein [bacterium]